MKNNFLMRATSVATGAVMLLAAMSFASFANADATAPTTNAATAVTSADATLNATNGTSAATDSSFWVSTSTFSEASSTSPTLPTGVYSTPSLGAQAAGAAFSASLSSTTGLPAIVPDTTYYYEGWTNVGGVWSPGGVLSFTTVSAPTITSVSPTSGTTAGGTAITITGTGFNTGATVTIGGTAATNVVVASSTAITATTPAGTTGAANVIVTNSDTGTVTSTGGFTYTTPAPGAPTVTAIAPMTGTTAGGTSVMITGTGFTGTTAVDFGATPATITATTSNTSLTVTSPVALSAGAVDVTVITPGGTSATSSADQFTYTAAATTTEPVISNIMVTNLGTSTATISWNTDVATSSGMVNYGTSASYGSTMAESSTPTMNHSITLTNLSEATLYHFDVQYGSTTSADNQFDTESTASTTPLAIDGVTTDQGTATADGTFADGWLWVMHLTVPSVEDAFRMAFSDFTSSSSSSTIPANSNIRIYSPESSNASTTSSAITETGNGYSGWMYLNGDTATSTAGRQIDVYINVAVPLGTAAGSYTTNFAAQSTPSSATSTTM